MDKKRLVRTLPPEDMKGFEEFIEGESSETSFLPKGNAAKKEVSFEHFTFLKNDSERLVRLKDLLNEKLPFSVKYVQADRLIAEQRSEISLIRKKLFEICDEENSPYRRSLAEIFDTFFALSDQN